MPGHGLSQVKCEPLSDEEDSDSQFAHSYLSSQVTLISILLLFSCTIFAGTSMI